jgi:nucleoside-diphosphate-sugar epimerase
MRIFITGGSGYIGSAVALACRRAGHDVFGLVRSAEKGRELARNEVRPIVGTLQNPDSYLSVAKHCSVLIHTAFERSADGVALDRKTVEALLSAAGGGSEPKTVIYTSGVWANGDSKCALMDETSPAAPIAAVAHRPAIEALVLGSSNARGIAIRPGLVYGGWGGLTGMWFGGALKDKSVKVIGGGNNHLPPIHVEDLADSYRRAAESGLKGELFLLADNSTATAKEMATAAARAAGYQGEVQPWPVAEAAKVMGGWVEGLGLDQHIDSGKARRLLGWEPKHRPFEEEAQTYFEAWKEHQAAAATSAAG